MLTVHQRSLTHSFQAFSGLVTFAKSTTLKANTSFEVEKPSLPRPANYAVPVQGNNNTVFLGAKSPGSTMLACARPHPAPALLRLHVALASELPHSVYSRLTSVFVSSGSCGRVGQGRLG